MRNGFLLFSTSLIILTSLTYSPQVATAQAVSTGIIPIAQSTGVIPFGFRYTIALKPDEASLVVINQTQNILPRPIYFWLGFLDKDKKLLDVYAFTVDESLHPGQRSSPSTYSSSAHRGAAFYKLIYRGERAASPDPPGIVFDLLEPKGSTGLTYSNPQFTVRFGLSPEGIAFVLTNRSDSPILVIWEESAYVDQVGKSHRVLHSEVRYIERDKAIPPSIIAPGTKIEDIVYPSSYVEFSSSSGWSQRNLYEELDPTPFTIGVFLTVQIKGQKRGFTFRFRARNDWSPAIKALFRP